MKALFRALKYDLISLDEYLDRTLTIKLNFKINFKKILHIHKWKLETTERHRVEIFKKLYEVNDWDRNYTIKHYRCSKCGAFKSE